MLLLQQAIEDLDMLAPYIPMDDDFQLRTLAPECKPMPRVPVKPPESYPLHSFLSLPSGRPGSRTASPPPAPAGPGQVTAPLAALLLSKR